MPNDQRLDGWKAIANFLGRERSTAIRWMNERGLPVHRVPGGRTATVYAIPAELEAWLAKDRAVVPELAPADTVEAPGNPVAFVQPASPARLVKVNRTHTVVGLASAVLAGVFGVIAFRAPPVTDAPVSIAAIASPGASRKTLDFAQALNADLARFANATPTLAVFERAPGATPDTDYVVRTEIEETGGRIIANARLVAVRQGQVIWSRRFEQSGQPFSELREQVAARIINGLRVSFGGLEDERLKARPADIEQLMAISEDFQQNNLAEAEARARAFTVARPDLGFGWAVLALIEGEMVGQGDRSRQALALANSRRAAALAPGNTFTWLARAAASGEGPTGPAALPILDAALRAHPGQASLLGVRSVVLFNLGYVQASVADSLQSLAIDPSSFGHHDIAVRRLAAAGRVGEALRLQSENERLWPRHPMVVANRSNVFGSGVHQHDADMKAISELEREYLASPHVAFTLARLHERSGNRAAALAWLARAPVTHTLQQASQLFWPDAAGLRSEPAFWRKMADLGLVRSWVARKKWPDFCAESGLRYSCRIAVD